MTLTRRRFLTISAAFAAAPAGAATHRWQGRALGAQVAITIRGPDRGALDQTRALLRRVEALFNLYDPQSVLSRLNRQGRLKTPPAEFLALLDHADTVHRATGGLFDPTVQPLWRALAEGGDITAARGLIGWPRISYTSELITLAPGQALTLNGIAQGYATDLVADVLRARGMRDVLVNIGEFRGDGGPWHLGLSDPVHGDLGMRTLTSGAIATSSPLAMPLAGQGHILHGVATPKWSTVSVEAASATLADGFSTALTLADLPLIRTLPGKHGITRITLVDDQGDLITL